MSVKGLLGPVAAGVGGLFASDDAESAVTLRLLQEGPAVYNKLRKQLARGRGGPRSTLSIAEDVLHDKSLANYDHFNGYARKADGGMSGDVYKSGVQGLYDEILGSVDEPDREVVAALDEWLEKRLGREYGVSMKDNRAIDLQKRRAAAGAGAGAAAVAGSGAASAGEEPLLGPGIPSAFGPQGESQTPEQRGFTPSPVYDPTPVTQRNQDVMFGGPMGALGGSFSGGADEYGIVADGTMQSMQAGGRLLFGLLGGEGWDGATNSAGKVINQGVEATQQQFGDYVENKTGDEVLGSWAKWLPYAAAPL
jgi:hypothetical protein